MVIGYFTLLLSVSAKAKDWKTGFVPKLSCHLVPPGTFESDLTHTQRCPDLLATFLGNFGLRFSLTSNGTAQQWQGQEPPTFFYLDRTSASRNFPFAVRTHMCRVRASFIFVCSGFGPINTASFAYQKLELLGDWLGNTPSLPTML